MISNSNQQQKRKASEPQFKRTTFRTRREMDFFSEQELVTQTGHPRNEWPFVIIKELIDNALDACDEKGIPPVIHVTADASGITVTDNGPGLPESTLKSAMDFTVRASNREAYVAPDRGAQGNALKTLLPMPWVLDPGHGRVIIEVNQQRSIIRCAVNPISQRVTIQNDVEPKCKNAVNRLDTINQGLSGTSIRLEWGPCSVKTLGNIFRPEWPFAEYAHVNYWRDDFRRIVEGFSLFNPHATIHLNWFGKETMWHASDPTWRKWKPSQPTSVHWYEQRHLERLIGAYVTHDREAGTDRLVTEFIGEFDGFSGSRKRAQILQETGLHRARLSELVLGEQFDSERIQNLLTAMKSHTRPVNARALGIIGIDHLRTRLLAMGVKPESFRYKLRTSSKCKNPQFNVDEANQGLSSLPWMIESAFGWLGDEVDDERQIYAGANWSATIGNPFRSFGNSGAGLEAALTEARVGVDEPIVFVLHFAHPRIEYTDRGKSAIVIGGVA